MRTLTAIAIAAAATFSGAAMAAPDNVQPADSSVQIRGTATRVQMNEDAFASFSGEYQLANGRKLTVSGYNARYFAKLDGEREQEIVPTGKQSFIGTATDLELRFGDIKRNGEANGVVVAARSW